MRIFVLVSWLVVLGAASGCATEKSNVTKRKVVWDYDQDRALSESEILERIREHPERPQPYFLLGQHYESMGRLVRAIKQYQLGADRFANAEGYQAGTAYTGADFRIGRCFARLSAFRRAIAYLQRVVALEPKELGRAVSNNHFKESHYLLGACYKESLDFTRARYHFDRYVRLGGTQTRIMQHLFEMKQQSGGLAVQDDGQDD